MGRYIDVDELLRKPPDIHDYYDESGEKDCTHGYTIATIKSAPTLSPDEVRGVGKWIRHDNYDWDDSFECSCCAEEFVMLDGETPTENGYNYCPSCGARMKGVSEE